MSTSFVPLTSVRLYVTSRISHSLRLRSDISVRGSECARGAGFAIRIANTEFSHGPCRDRISFYHMHPHVPSLRASTSQISGRFAAPRHSTSSCATHNRLDWQVLFRGNTQRGRLIPAARALRSAMRIMLTTPHAPQVLYLFLRCLVFSRFSARFAYLVRV